MTARRYGRFVVLETLGAGGMGDVYRAHDERLGRDVAIKTIRGVPGLNTEAFRSRFLAEARALGAISHPAIVGIHDIGIENEEPFLILELVDGPSLKAILAEGPLAVSDARRMGIQIAQALTATHARQILHRDLKPANILRGSDGQWKLADFGIARVPDSDLTLTGQFLGTPAYGAPESLVMSQFSEKSDVYSLAATIVEAITGAKLRGSTGVTELLQRGDIAVDLPPSVPADLASALRPALSIDPRQRPTAHELAALLASEGRAAVTPVVLPAASGPIVARLTPRTRIVLGSIAGLLAIGVLAAILTRGGGPPERTDVPAITPGRVTVVYPKGIDREAYAAFSRVVKKVRERKFGEALKELDGYERAFDATPETEHLRAQIEALPRSAR